MSQLAKWSLILFVFVSLLVMVYRNFFQDSGEGAGFGNINPVSEFHIPEQNGVIILLFHRTKRCEFCNNMEAHTRDALSRYFPNEKNIYFRLVDMDLPQFKKIRERYQLFTSTLMLIDLSEGRDNRWRVLTEAWELNDSREDFVRMFKNRLTEFMEKKE